jgi:hypothetical protein
MNFVRKSILSMIKLLDGALKSFIRSINNLVKTLLLTSTTSLYLSYSKKFQKLSANNLSKSSTRKKKRIEVTSLLRIS